MVDKGESAYAIAQNLLEKRGKHLGATGYYVAIEYENEAKREFDEKGLDPKEWSMDGYLFQITDGTENINPLWFDNLKKCIISQNLVLILCARLEEGEARAHGEIPTHYLVVVGYNEEISRRGTKRILHIKDPMEGDEVMQGEIKLSFVTNKIVLQTVQTKDWYRPLECICLTNDPQYS